MGFSFIPSKQAIQLLIFYIALGIGITFVPVISLIGFVVRFGVSIVTSFESEYGKLLNYIDCCNDEDFVNGPPKTAILTTITLDGPLSIEKLREIFTKNVLEATLPMQGQKKGGAPLRITRYPEFQQYITTYWGFRIWKNELDFQVDQHILEEQASASPVDLSSFHENLINKPFHKYRSPWEITLTQNVVLTNDDAVMPKTLLAIRIHHSMADAKSILKCFVECLGGKPLKTAVPFTLPRENSSHQLNWCLTFLLNYVHCLGKIFWYAVKCHSHPWKTMMIPTPDGDISDTFSDKVPLVVRLSPKIQLAQVKQVAKQHAVLTSSVILSIIGGAIGKYDLRGDHILVGLPQPKEGHPSVLTNHTEFGMSIIPTGGMDPVQRLKECNRIQMEMKLSGFAKYVDTLAYLFGNLFVQWRRILAVNYYAPAAISNIAGELEGFSIGGVPCSEYSMCVGTFQGCCGVTFCCFSYKNALRVAVVSKETVLSAFRAHQLANEIEKELEIISQFKK